MPEPAPDELAAALRRAREAEAERLAAPPPTPEWPPEILEAAQLLGAKPGEVRRVYQAPEGLVIDVLGIEHVVVPADRPDRYGRTGVMLRRPTPSANTNRSARILNYLAPDPTPPPPPEPPPPPPWVPPWNLPPEEAAAWAADLEANTDTLNGMDPR